MSETERGVNECVCVCLRAGLMMCDDGLSLEKTLFWGIQHCDATKIV